MTPSDWFWLAICVVSSTIGGLFVGALIASVADRRGRK